MKVLIIEDDLQLADLISSALKKESYRTENAYDYKSALSKALVYDYDCILLDITLPDGNGLDILRELKKKDKQDNVIIISAKDSTDDKIDGLDLGADDYLTKPFHLSELIARIRCVIRRNYRQGKKNITIGNVIVEPENFSVHVGDTLLNLGRKEFEILLFFIDRPNRLISKESLAEGVWGDYIDQADNFDFIYSHIKNLRKKLTSAQASIEIKSIYGFGYKLVCDE